MTQHSHKPIQGQPQHIYLPQEVGSWVNNYLGIPWVPRGSTRSGASCLGLRNLVYQECLNIELPRYEDVVDALEKLELVERLEGGIVYSTWQEIDPCEAREFDVISFRLRRLEAHVGVVTKRNHMLHVCEGRTSYVDRYTSDEWRPLKPRFYRYVKRPSLEKLPLLHRNELVPHIIQDMTGYDDVIVAPEGSTILDVIKIAFPGVPNTALCDIRVTLGLDIINREYWHLVKPKRWDLVVIRVVPSAHSLLRIFLTLAVVIGAAAISAGALGPLATAAGLGGWLAAGTVSAAVAGAVVGLGGALLVNTLIPVAKPGTQSNVDLPSYNINGFSNVLNADGVVPSVLGQLRFAPPLAALPYTFNYGNFRYAAAIFLVGYGPIDISDIWIGNTPIANYLGVSVEIRNGYPDDALLTLYPTQVIEDADNPLDMIGSVVNDRISAVSITAFEVELYFPNGLIAYNQDSVQQVCLVQFEVAWRRAGSSIFVGSPITVAGIQTQPFWRSFRYDVADRGQYEIEFTRVTGDLDAVTQGNIRFVSKSTWSALRSFRPEYPLNYKKPMALIAIRMQASWQLGGSIQNVSCMARRICKDWDPTSGTWITRATSNPTSLARYVLQGPENAFPRTDDQLDLVDFQDWGTYSVDNNLHFDAVYSSDNSQDQVLDDVCSAGRALKHDRGDKYTIIVDSPRTTFTSHITPANSWDFTYTNPKVLFPDAFIVSFLDKTNNYNPTKRTIPWPSFVGVPQITQELVLPGKVDPAEIWRETRRRQYEAELRQDGAQVTQDMEQLTSTRGSGVRVAHYVLNKRQFGGYVIAVSADGNLVRIDSIVTMEASVVYQARFRHIDGTTILRTLVTVEGENSTLMLAGSGNQPVEGDLVMVGRLNLVTSDWIVKAIEENDNAGAGSGGGTTFAATLALVPSAPTLDGLAASEIPPAWDGIIGNDNIVVDATPDVPLITDIESGAATIALVTPGDTHPVTLVVVEPGGVSAVTAFQVQYKLHTDVLYTVELPFAAGSGSTVINGFASGAILDIQARAINGSAVSAWTDVTQYTVLDNGVGGNGGFVTSLLALGQDVNLGETSAASSFTEDLGNITDASTYAVALGDIP